MARATGRSQNRLVWRTSSRFGRGGGPTAGGSGGRLKRSGAPFVRRRPGSRASSALRSAGFT